MKNLFIYRFTGLMVFFSFMALQSCSVWGLMVGGIGDTLDNSNDVEPIVSGQGWVEPVDGNNMVHLVLSNGATVKGEYKGCGVFEQEGRERKVALVRVGKTIKHIPIDMVSFTSVYQMEKSRAMTGFYVGLGIDMVLLYMLIDTDINFNEF